MEKPLTFEETDLSRVRALRDALKNVQVNLSLPELVTLLTIAIEPGLSINDLADRDEIPQQSASRYASMLLGRYQDPSAGKPISPLIEYGINLNDPRKRAMYITEEGLRLIRSFL